MERGESLAAGVTDSDSPATRFSEDFAYFLDVCCSLSAASVSFSDERVSFSDEREFFFKLCTGGSRCFDLCRDAAKICMNNY